MVVAQLGERSLPTPEVYCFKDEIDKKRPGLAHLKEDPRYIRLSVSATHSVHLSHFS